MGYWNLRTVSSVLRARSDTNGRAMGGMRADAGRRTVEVVLGEDAIVAVGDGWYS